MSDLICLGVIIGTHGVKGRIKVKTFTDQPENLTKYGKLQDHDGKVYDLHITSFQPKNIIAEVVGVKSMEAAEELVGKELFVRRDQLPEPKDGSYYYEDLVGLEVRLGDRTKFGQIKSMSNFGAGDIAEITLEKNGRDEMFSFNSNIFPEINMKEGYVVINPSEVIEVK